MFPREKSNSDILPLKSPIKSPIISFTFKKTKLHNSTLNSIMFAVMKNHVTSDCDNKNLFA